MDTNEIEDGAAAMLAWEPGAPLSEAQEAYTRDTALPHLRALQALKQYVGEGHAAALAGDWPAAERAMNSARALVGHLCVRLSWVEGDDAARAAEGEAEAGAGAAPHGETPPAIAPEELAWWREPGSRRLAAALRRVSPSAARAVAAREDAAGPGVALLLSQLAESAALQGAARGGPDAG